MAENIKTGFTALGNIEAAISDCGVIRRVVVDARTSDLVDHANVYPDTDLFRQLIRSARDAFNATGRGKP